MAGNWSNSDLFTENSGTVTFDGTGAQTLTGETFYNLTINNTAASPDDSTDIDSSAAVTVTNTLTVTDGQFQPTTASDFNGALTIGAAGILKPDSSASITVAGTWTNSGTFTANSGTVTFDGTSGTIDIVSGGSAFNALTFNDGGGTATFELEDALDVNGNLTITGGTLDTKSTENNAITLAGNWSNSDLFTARSGTATLDGTSQSITGSTNTTFYNLTKSVSAADTLTFNNARTTTVSNNTTLKGASGTLLSLRSDSVGTQFEIDVSSTGTRDIQYVDVQDSNNTNATAIDCSTGCVNSGNNTGWTFPASGSGDSGSDTAGATTGGSIDDLLDSAGDIVKELASALFLEQGTLDASNRRIVSVALGQPVTLTTRPVEADRLQSLTITVNGQTYTLKPHPNNPAVYTVTLDGFAFADLYPYTLTANYGSTTRSEKGFILVLTAAAPTQTEISAPVGPTGGEFLTLSPQLDLGEPSVTPLDEKEEITLPAGQEPRTVEGQSPSVISVVGNFMNNLAYSVGTTFRQAENTVAAFMQAAGRLLADLIVYTGKLAFAVGRAVIASVMGAIQTAFNVVGLGSEVASDSTLKLWQNAHLTFNDAVQQLIARTADIASPAPTQDPRIPEHLRGHIYDEVIIHLSDNAGNPLAGALVTLASQPRTKVANRQGQAAFKNVPVGEHSLTIAFGKYSSRQSLFLNADAPRIAVALQGTLREGLHPLWWLTGLVVAVALCGYLTWKITWVAAQRTRRA